MFRRLFYWLFVEPRHFWLGVGVPAVALVIAFRAPVSEQAVRLVGLALQLMGILTVVWGILKTWEFFKLGDPIAAVKAWLHRFPFRPLPTITAHGSATEQDDVLFSRGHTSWSAPAGATLEDRVATLEKNLPLLHERITSTQTDLHANVCSLRAEIAGTHQTLAAETQQINDRVTSLGTGSLHISAIGAVWLFVGSVLGTASQEVAALLK